MKSKFYYETKDCKIFNDDCLNILRKLSSNSIDMVLCDLPYGTTACKWDTIIPFEPLWEQYKRIIKDNRAIVLFGSEPFSSALRMSNIKEFKYDWVWDKVRPSGFQIAKYVPMKRHELISVFSRGTPKWNRQMKLRDKPVKGRVASKSDSSPIKYNDGKVRTYTHKNPQSILVFSKASDGKYLHPTQKPVALFEYLIKTYTNEREAVLDNCLGSGTTAIACKNLNRRCIGIEMNKEYCDISIKRLKEIK